MKILEEPLLLNNLNDLLDVVLEQKDITLIKRVNKEAVIAMSLEQYNKLMAKLYHLQEGEKNENKTL